jgi:hypothetical protein
MSTFHLTYGDTPPSLNAGGTGSRRHWAVGYREKKRWQEIYTGLLLEQRVPKGMSHCRVHVALSFKDGRRRDVENYRPAVSKPLADALVAGGWLADDTAAEFTLAAIWINHEPELTHSCIAVTLEPEYEVPA